MLIHDLHFEPYISSQEIKESICGIAARINADYANAERKPLILITLGGAVIFASDLVRCLDFVSDIAFVKCSSYNSGMKSCGDICFELDVTLPFEGRDVIVVEDIVDTGNTYSALHKHLIEKGAKSVRIASLLLKPEVYNKPLKIDYIGREIDNIFVIGMGLDYNQLGRNLDCIYKLSK